MSRESLLAGLCRSLTGLALLCLTGCSIIGYDPYPSVRGTQLDQAAAKAFLTQALSVSQQVHSFRAMLRSRIEVHGEKDVVRHVLVFAKPDRLRLETFPLNSAFTLSLVGISGGRLVVLDTTEKKAYAGPASAEALRQAVALPLEASDLMAYISGRLPERLAAAANIEIFFDQEGQRYFIKEGEFVSFFAVDPQTHLLKSLEIRDPQSDRTVLSMSYQDYQMVQGLSLPKRCLLKLPRESMQMQLSVSSVAINGDPSADLFQPEIPSDYSMGDGLAEVPDGGN